MYSFAALGSLQFVGIAITGILLTAFLLFLILREQKTIKAIDGTAFASEEACRTYEILLDKMSKLYAASEKNSVRETFGLKPEFLQLLKNEGFSEVKTLIKYRKEFEQLTNLFNQEID